MANHEKYGTDWEADEIGVVAAAYFSMRESDLRGLAINKAAAFRELSTQIGRTNKSVERKFCNISAVLAKLEEPWIRGLAPDSHYQKALSEAVDFQLSKVAGFAASQTSPVLEAAEEQAGFIPHPQAKGARLDFVPIPDLRHEQEKLPEHLERLIRKFDPVMRDFRAREIGEAGERLVLDHERAKLANAGCTELARKIVWVSKELGDGAGYDIKSYETNGREKFIEVKTTVGSQTAPFFMTRNEKAFADEGDDRYRIARIFDFRRQPRAFELKSPLGDFVRFEPESYRVSFT